MKNTKRLSKYRRQGKHSQRGRNNTVGHLTFMTTSKEALQNRTWGAVRGCHDVLTPPLRMNWRQEMESGSTAIPLPNRKETALHIPPSSAFRVAFTFQGAPEPFISRKIWGGVRGGPCPVETSHNYTTPNIIVRLLPSGPLVLSKNYVAYNDPSPAVLFAANRENIFLVRIVSPRRPRRHI